MEIEKSNTPNQISFVMMSHNLASLLIDWLEYSKEITLTVSRGQLLIENEHGSELCLDVETTETNYEGKTKLNRVAAKRIVGILMMMRTQQIRVTHTEGFITSIEFGI